MVVTEGVNVSDPVTVAHWEFDRVALGQAERDTVEDPEGQKVPVTVPEPEVDAVAHEVKELEWEVDTVPSLSVIGGTDSPLIQLVQVLLLPQPLLLHSLPCYPDGVNVGATRAVMPQGPSVSTGPPPPLAPPPPAAPRSSGRWCV